MYKICDTKNNFVDSDNDENNNEIRKLLEEIKWNESDDDDIETQQNENMKYRKKMELKDWLEHDLELSEYYQLFIDEGIDDLQTLKLLNYEQLKEIGVKKLGHRLKILQKAKETKLYHSKDDD